MFRKLRDTYMSPVSAKAKSELRTTVAGILLTRFRQLRTKKGEREMWKHSSEELSAMLEEVTGKVEGELEGSSLHRHRKELQKLLNDQSSSLLQKISALEADMDANLKKFKTRDEFVKASIGWSLEVKKSGIENAGDGLYVDGRVGAGSLIGWFPGDTWLPEHLKKQGSMKQFLDDPKHLTLLRHDDTLIDSRSYFSKCHETNPYTLAHFANHPEKGVKPNVIHLPIDFPADVEHEEVAEFLPNRYPAGFGPTWLGTPDRSCCGYGIGLIASRDVEDEEVFMNYKFNPDAEGLPDWFDGVEGGDEGRWKED